MRLGIALIAEIHPTLVSPLVVTRMFSSMRLRSADRGNASALTRQELHDAMSMRFIGGRDHLIAEMRALDKRGPPTRCGAASSSKPPRSADRGNMDIRCAMVLSLEACEIQLQSGAAIS